MNILVLGGTLFLGRHIVDTLLKRDHTVTLFNRGMTNKNLFPDVETIVGDRAAVSDLARLKGRRWDAVIDTSGYLPNNLKQVTGIVRPLANQYIFISSISVYESADAIDEDAPVAKISSEGSEDIQKDYGALKALSEKVVLETFAESALIVRAGFLIGPYDPTPRLPFWVQRIADGGRVLCPGSFEAPFQFIDARDCAKWVVLAIEKSIAGVYNVTGPSSPTTLGEILNKIKAETGRVADFEWVPDQFLIQQGVSVGAIPFWLPKKFANFMRKDISKAISKGLTTRSSEESIADVYAWLKSEGFRGIKATGVQIPSDWSAELESRILREFDLVDA